MTSQLEFSAADLSIIIPTRQRWDRLAETLAALEAQTVRGFETIVVVDGTDQRPPHLPSARVIEQEHAGPGVARNRGVAASDRPLVLFLGDDMVPLPQLVARHVARHQLAPAEEVAILGRAVWHPQVPHDRVHRWLDWSSALFDYRQLDDQAAEDAGWPRFYSSNVSLKRAFFVRSGGFDADFVFDYEDLDLAYRLGQNGMRLLYERAAIAEHLHPYSWSAVRRRYESRARAERLMLSKHEWFSPWFRGQIERAANEPPVSRAWVLAVDAIPRRPHRLRRAFENRANRHYLQRLAAPFFAAWEAAGAPRDRSVRTP